MKLYIWILKITKKTQTLDVMESNFAKGKSNDNTHQFKKSIQ
jgi:hypothetical protein